MVEDAAVNIFPQSKEKAKLHVDHYIARYLQRVIDGPRNECRAASPKTGQLCTMGKGHAGPHKAGGPYHSVEDWVTPCAEGCTYHSNRKWNGSGWDLFEECIRCGQRALPEPDFTFHNQGSIFLIEPHNDNAAGHLRATSSTLPWQWIGDSLVVDHRFARDIATRLQAAGYKVA